MPQNLVHLQGIGKVPGIPAKDLIPGMTVLWNYGYTSEVINTIPSATGKTLTLVTKSHTDGKEYRQKVKTDRFIAVKK